MSTLQMAANAAAAAELPQFETLDKNADTAISLAEFQGVNSDLFLHSDRNFDGRLNRKEYKGYKSALKRAALERNYIPRDDVAILDIPYVNNGHPRQKFDLYLPKDIGTSRPRPLVIWIHGGGWQRGTKQLIGQQTALLNHGFAVASINYRLTDTAPFPAQLHDGKAAIRYIRKNAGAYGIDPDKIGLWGASAGGHIAALLAATGDDPAMEGSLGETGISSKIQAVTVWYGPVDMHKMYELLISRQPGNPDLSRAAVPKLFGGMQDTQSDLITQGSPLSHISPDDPPFLIMHADADPIVPTEQSYLLRDAVEQMGIPHTFQIIKSDKHAYFRGETENMAVHDFFRKYLAD